MDILFIFKKIFSLLLMPLSISIILFIFTLYLVYKNSYKIKIYFIFSILFISIISSNIFSNFLLEPLESSYSKLNSPPKDVKYILLLGGDRISRGWEVLRLYHKLKNVKIVTSGYEGTQKIPEAIRTAKVLENIGIPKNDIIIHSKPKDTLEEAYKIKKMIKDDKFILVTSAYHMKRAITIFKSIGLNPIAAPTNFLIKPANTIVQVPDAYELLKTQRALHEYIGILWFKVNNILRRN